MNSWGALRFLRAYPALLRAYFARALEYRAIIVVWALASVFPLIMLAVWLSVAQGGQIGAYDTAGFAGYFLGVIFTRRMVGVWVVWDLDRAIREGEMSSKLLRPMHPIHFDFARVVSAKPLNLALVLPPVALAALLIPGVQFSMKLETVAAYLVAVFLGLLIELLVQWCVGCLAFWWSHVTALQEMWFVVYSLFGGQVIPLDLLPGGWAQVAYWLPFRYLMGFQVGIMTGRLGATEILAGYGVQLLWLAFFGGLFMLIWRRGLRQYGAVGA